MTAQSWWTIHPRMPHKQVELWGITSTSGHIKTKQQTFFIFSTLVDSIKSRLSDQNISSVPISLYSWFAIINCLLERISQNRSKEPKVLLDYRDGRWVWRFSSWYFPIISYLISPVCWFSAPNSDLIELGHDLQPLRPDNDNNLQCLYWSSFGVVITRWAKKGIIMHSLYLGGPEIRTPLIQHNLP